MFVPRTARLLFTDPGLTEDFRSQWFAWANPAETMLAYAKFISNLNPNVDLWALAVSTSDGGSAMPARTAGLVHFDEVSRFDVRPDMTTSQLDEAHMHRLETLDRAQYVRTAGFGDLPKPGVSEAWRATQTAVQVVLERLGMVRDFGVPPVIREIMDALQQGIPVRDDRWVDLDQVFHEAAATGAGLRSGRIPGDGPASAHVRAYSDLARLAEMLLLWKNSTMAHAELSYLTLTISRTPLVA
ncbi:hypothetical protein B5P44_06805 [Mycobacterium sp. CBMA 213]|nr:hypothetical protein [Mycolicibacterium sp. CBMA 213]